MWRFVWGSRCCKVTFELCKQLGPIFLIVKIRHTEMFLKKPTNQYEAIAASNGPVARFLIHK